MIQFKNKPSKQAENNKGAPQGCPLSPTLFNTYLDEIITKWQNQDITGIKLSKNQQLSTLLYSDDCVLIADRILLTLQRGVTGTAPRMLHALTHSSISRQVREQM